MLKLAALSVKRDPPSLTRIIKPNFRWVELLWTERAAYPLQKCIMLGVGRIIDCPQELFVPGSTATVLGRTASCPIQAAGIYHSSLGLISALETNLVQPRITKVILVQSKRGKV